MNLSVSCSKCRAGKFVHVYHLIPREDPPMPELSVPDGIRLLTVFADCYCTACIVRDNLHIWQLGIDVDTALRTLDMPEEEVEARVADIVSAILMAKKSLAVAPATSKVESLELATKGELAQLRSENAKFRSELAEMRDALAQLKIHVKTNSYNIDVNSNNMNQIRSTVGTHTDEIRDTREICHEFQTQISCINHELAGLRSENAVDIIRAVKDDVVTIKNKLAQLDDSQRSEIAKLYTQIGYRVKEAADTRGTCDAFLTQLSRSNVELEEIKNKIAKHHEHLKELQNHQGNIYTGINQLHDKHRDVTSTIAKLNSDRVALNKYTGMTTPMTALTRDSTD